MPVFEFTSPKGETFELEGPEGSTEQQAFQKFKEMRPELFGQPSPKKEAKTDDLIGGIQKEQKEKFQTSPAARFGETFQPVKAITEEGMIPQLYQYGKRKMTGEPAPKEKEAPEQPVSLKQTFGRITDFAKKDPGAFAGAIANAIVADPEFLLMPEFLPAKVVSSIEKVSKLGAAGARTADAATQAAAMAAGQSAARQLNERGSIDMNVLRQEAKNAAAFGGGTRALGEAGRYVAPGAKKYASEGTQRMLEMAKERGYTLPPGEMSPLGALIDKYYQTPIRGMNKTQFYKEISEPTGTKVSEINTKTLPEIEKNLDTEIKGVMRNQRVSVPASVDSTLQTFLPYQEGRIQSILEDIRNGRQISGDNWHDVRSQLGMRAAKARQSNPVMADDIDNVIKAWDSYAQGSLSSNVIDRFNTWKGHYAAYKDIDTAIHSNPTAYQNYLNGTLEPKDVMTAIRGRRPAEARDPFDAKTRPQTTTAALGEGLGLMGKEPLPTTFFTAMPKLGAAAVAKPTQAAMYSPLGQSLLYKGIPFTGMAPYLGASEEKVGQSRRK